eukprot:11760770-Alexandrium_andersonii.AAC.1
MRDLGAMMNLSQHAGNGIQGGRFYKAARVARALLSVHPPYAVTAKALKGKILPCALYGCAVSCVPQRAKQVLQGAMANAMIGRNDSLRTPGVALTFAGLGVRGLDCAISMGRLMVCRRVMAKKGQLLHVFRESWN